MPASGFFPQAIKGLWWLPASPEKRVPGTLHVLAGKFPRLELEGQILVDAHFAFLDKLTEEAAKGWPIKAIHGVTYDNQRAALLECFPQGTTSRSGGANTERYVSRFVLFGDLPAALSDVRTREFHIQATELARWSGVAHTVVATTETSRHVSIDTKFPAPVVVPVPSLNATLQLRFSWTGTFARHNARLKVIPRLSLIRKDAVSLQEQVDTIASLLTLVSVCVGTSSTLLECQLDPAGTLSDADYRAALWPIRTSDSDDNTSVWDVAVAFGTVTALKDGWVDAWFQWAEAKRLAVRIVLNLLEEEGSSAESVFVRATQAAETFARLRYGEDKTIGEAGAKVVEALISAIPLAPDARFAKRLSRYLTNFGRPSLGWYLNKLIGELDDETAAVIGLSSAWGEKVAERRNKLVHHLTTGADDGSEASIAFRDTRRLVLLVLLCTLADLGVAPPAALKGFRRHPWVNQVKMYARDVL